MRKIFWLHKAMDDMDDIYKFYVDKNPIAGVRMYNNILAEIKRLCFHPNLGKVESFNDESDILFRSLVVASGRYKAIYYLYKDSIYISQIWDCRKDPASMRKM